MADQGDLARELLKLAGDDEIAAREMLPVDAVTDDIIGFHAQQAVEKSLKAVLASRGIDFPFTHDLAALVELCEGAGIELPAPLAEVDRLTPYGARLRYGRVLAADVDRNVALSWAAAAVVWAAELIG